MKLPLPVKHLLTLRNPQANRSPSIERLHGVFAPTLQEATRHKAQDGWLVLATSTLLSANVPSAVGHLYHYVSRRTPLSSSDAGLLTTEARTAQAALMREAAVKSAIFVGVPRVCGDDADLAGGVSVGPKTILSLEALTGALEDDVKTSLRQVSHREANATNIEKFVQRGRDLWKDIYSPHDVKLANKLASYHPDFIFRGPAFIIQSYGTVLSPWPPSDPTHGSGNVNRTLTSVLGTACLRTEGGVGPQLTSHVFGLLKSHGDGYAGEPATEGDRWLSSAEGTEWVINTVDALCDVVRLDSGSKSKL
ncbi:hypothetical protein JB92DRAFT_2828247 [Gautieria morchelliformis]|nr:hypothetical protein JB92DRAFT_2828247 [Gautieria morchelliformis]